MILDADSSFKGGKYKELNKYTNIYNIARKKNTGSPCSVFIRYLYVEKLIFFHLFLLFLCEKQHKSTFKRLKRRKNKQLPYFG